MPFPKPGQPAYQETQLRDLFLRHPETTIIWAHVGLGRVIQPVKDQLAIVDRALSHPGARNLYIDLSWDETAKYIVATPETIQATAALINRHPDRFLFGTDEVAPTNQKDYLKVYDMYAPLFAQLTADGQRKSTKAELRTPLRRGAAPRAGLGKRQREGLGAGQRQALMRRWIHSNAASSDDMP